jgi:hypothetical protein
MFLICGRNPDLFFASQTIMRLKKVLSIISGGNEAPLIFIRLKRKIIGFSLEASLEYSADPVFHKLKGD